MLIVVADTSPILNLERIGRVDLLPALYSQVLIPSVVSAELATFNVGPPLSAWISVAEPANEPLVRRLRSDLDSGEAEAIALAVERQAMLLLIDQKHGRRIAETFGLQVTGLIGILADAKEARLIERVRPYWMILSLGRGSGFIQSSIKKSWPNWARCDVSSLSLARRGAHPGASADYGEAKIDAWRKPSTCRWVRMLAIGRPISAPQSKSSAPSAR